MAKVLRVAEAASLYRGQLTPSFPDVETVAPPDVVMQRGGHGSLWLRLRAMIARPDFEGLVAECEEKATGAAYVAIPQSILAADGGLLAVLLERSFKFYHHNSSFDELIWYRWVHKDLPDLVPTYASSIEGGGALVLSPDQKKALLVFEFGRWGRCGGSVDPGESCLQTARRECVEETSVQLDPDFAPLLGMSYNQARSRDQLINDHFCLFILRALSLDLKVDGNEITDAKWIDIDEAVGAWRAFNSKPEAHAALLPKQVPVGGQDVGVLELLALEKFVEGRCQRVVGADFGNTVPRDLFI